MGKAASFGSSELTRSAGYSSSYVLTIKQEPGESKAVAKQEKARGAKWPLDPPPVLELTIDDQRSQSSAFLHSPFWFCNVEIDVISHQGSLIPKEKLLIGTTVSSLHRVKHNDRTEKGYFIFGDLNIRAAGTYRLKFSLFEMRQGADGMFAEHLGSSVHTKQFQGDVIGLGQWIGRTIKAMVVFTHKRPSHLPTSSQLSQSTLWHNPPTNWSTRDHFDVPSTTMADYTSPGYSTAQYVPTTAGNATPFRLYTESSGELVQLPSGSSLTHFDPSAYSASTGDASESLAGSQGQYTGTDNYGLATYSMHSLSGSMGVPGGGNMAVGGIAMGSGKVCQETNAYLPTSSTPVNPPQRGQGLPTPPQERRAQTMHTQNAGQYTGVSGYPQDPFTSQSSQGNPYYQG
ncbi:hypothetical protein DV737_g5212, partial [Chaetothyriales sp. CBS 132003]